MDYCSEAQSELGVSVQPVLMKSFKDFEEQIKRYEPHVMVVDLKLGESSDDRSGWESVRRVLEREIIPVIVYSAFAREEPEEVFNIAIIKRIVKSEGQEFIAVLKSGIRMKIALNKEKDRINKEFSRLTLQTLGKIFSAGDTEEIDESILVNLASGRLISYLLNFPPEGEKFPPESIFIYPVLDIFSNNCLLLGEFLEQYVNDSDKKLWLVMSPSCDLIYDTKRKAKVSNVLLLRCYRDYHEIPYLKDEENDNKRRGGLEDKIIGGRNGKILKSPEKIFSSKYIVISFKEYISAPYQRIIEGLREGTWNKLAALSLPYAESLKNLFVSDLSRIGTPTTAEIEEERRWIGEFVR